MLELLVLVFIMSNILPLDDYIAIFDKFKNNFIGKGFPDYFIVILEISVDNDGEKLICNYNNGVNFEDNFKYKL